MKNYHDETTKVLLLCTQCPKQFDGQKKLRSHLTTHEKKMFSCNYCEKKFTKSVNVQAHIKSIHQLEKNFLCSNCGKNFSTKGALKEHQIIHQNIYPYRECCILYILFINGCFFTECSSCPKKFKNLPRLKTHADTHNNTK